MGRLNILFILILIGIYSCESNRNEEEILSIIENVKSERVPDKRTAIFDIHIDRSGPIALSGETDLPQAKDRLLDLLSSDGYEIEDNIKVLPDLELGERKFGLINVSVANLRAEPRHSSELVTQALLGTPVKLLKKEKGWFLMQTPDKYIAWSNSGSITRVDMEQMERWTEANKIIYLDTYGFSVDSASGKRVSDLVAGSMLALKNESKSSWHVLYPDGRSALIDKREASIYDSWKIDQSNSTRSFATTAYDLMGVPYLWGGTSTKGLDCSGFTKTVYLLHGLVLPRDASQQVDVGQLVDTDKDFSKLQVGDLLFFGRKDKNQKERVVHVGMWLGNNQFIHASSDVHINSMDVSDDNFDQYNYDRYLRSKRISGAATTIDESTSQLFQ